MAISYCTLAQANTIAKIGNTDGAFEAYYKAVYDQVTARIDELTNRNTFAPRIATYNYDGYKPDLNNGVLFLGRPVLSVTSIVTNGETTIDAANYTVESRFGEPAMTIYSDDSWTFTDNRRQAIAVAGIWGYRRYYDSEGWLSTTTLNGAVSTPTATSITVTDATNIDAGDMLRIDTEFISVTDKTGNVLTVARGIRGSTAVTHLTGVAVERWIPEPAIVRAAAIMIAYAYNRRGDYAQVEFSTDIGVGVSFPADQPLQVLNILREYRLGRSKVI